MANYISCSSCGMTYLENAERRCPHCGTAKERVSGGFDLAEMRFDIDRISLKSFIILLAATVLLAAVNFIFAAHMSSNYADERADLEQVKVIIESGQYAEIRMEYEDMKQKIENGYKFTDDQLKEFREMDSAMKQLPDDIYGALADAEALFGYIDFRIVLYVVTGVALIIAAILVALRFRLSFRALIGATILCIALVVIMEVWGAVMDYKSIDPYFISAFAACCFAIIKECIGCDALVFSGAAKASSSSAVVGASMPKVQELYSFEDMPELSGMKGLDDAQPQETQDAQDDVMDAIDPIGVANTTSDKPKFQPSEVAPDVEPVVPLTNYQVGGSITDEGENVAITPLQRPMFEVDMMEDEAMPSIGGAEELMPAVAQTMSVETPPEFVQEPVSAKGIWFCSVCGSLNENILICDTCGANKQ